MLSSTRLFIFIKYLLLTHNIYYMQANTTSSPYRIHTFSLCYFLAMVSYSATTTMMYSLYAQNDIGTLALINSIFGFIGFGSSNLLVLFIIRKWNLKLAVVAGFLGLILADLSIVGTIFVIETDIAVLSSLFVVYPINIICCFVGGVSNSLIWTIMPIYIQTHCNKIEQFHRSSNPDEQQSKNSMSANIGLFWAICQWSVVIGGLINIFILGYVNQYAYIFVILAIAAFSVLMALFYVEQWQIEGRTDSIEGNVGIWQRVKIEARGLVNIMKNSNDPYLGFPNIFVYNFLSGLFLSFYPIFMNHLIRKSLPSDYSTQTFSRLTATVFIFQGVSSIAMGITQNKLYFIFSQNKQKLLMWALSVISSVCVLTMFAYNVAEPNGEQYWVCFIVIVCWALVETHIKTNAEAYVRQYNGGKLEYYSLGILFYSIGSIANYLLQIVAEPNGQLIALGIVGTVAMSVWIVREPDIEYLITKVEQQKLSLMTQNLVNEQDVSRRVAGSHEESESSRT